MTRFLKQAILVGIILLISQCATVRHAIPFMESDTTLSGKDFWKSYAAITDTPHDVAGSGFIQIDVPNFAVKVRANYQYSSIGTARLELATLITGDLAEIYLKGDSAIVNDLLNRQSFADVAGNLELPGMGNLSVGDWGLNTLFLGLVQLDKKKWKFSKKPSPKLSRENEEINLDTSGRIRNWLVRSEPFGPVIRQLDLDYQTSTARFPVVITISDFAAKRKLKLTHQKVVWDDPDFQVYPVTPTYSPIFQFSKLRDK